MPLNANGEARCDVCLKKHNRRVYDVDGNIASYCLEHDIFKEKKCIECGETFKPRSRYTRGTIMCLDCRALYLKRRARLSSAFIE